MSHPDSDNVPGASEDAAAPSAVDRLRELPLFEDLGEEQRRLLATRVTERRFSPGEVVFREGDPGDRLFVMVEGSMRVYVEREGRVVTYGRILPGECFGELALLEGSRRSATVAAEAASHCLTLAKDEFLELLRQHPPLALQIMKDQFKRLRHGHGQLQDYARRLARVPEASETVFDFSAYDTERFWDEMIQPNGRPRPGAELLVARLAALPAGELLRRQRAAERTLLHLGITFNVYGERAGVERIFPFDVLPRIVAAAEWKRIERGLVQRIRALNRFVDDVYHERAIVRDGIVPEALVASAKNVLPSCQGLDPPRGVWCHVTGTDLVRDADGTIHVLEDNLRCPSGVSYVIENRQVLKRTFPQLFDASKVRPVDDYPSRLLAMLQSLAPSGVDRPTVVVLTPGRYNSAFFEHAFLAQQMGVELVEGRDLVVEKETVRMRTTRGLTRVDVIYRRIDDDCLDPLVFRPDSLLGVPGLMEVYRAGRVALANAPGTGIADDKALYAYVPRMIRYYLGEEAILPNVPTFVCWNDDEREHVLAHLDELVVKAVNESGGYGMLIGPHAPEAERGEFADRIRAHPRNYIAQPTLALSRAPVIVGDRLEGRHVDLRPYILYGDEIWVLPGGLTRVALRKGSLVVNSSQGGGSKDTWVLDEEAPC